MPRLKYPEQEAEEAFMDSNIMNRTLHTMGRAAAKKERDMFIPSDEEMRRMVNEGMKRKRKSNASY